MGKASDPPKCKACGEQHWGTCLDPESRGYLSSRAAPATVEVKQQRIAKATEVLASVKPTRQKKSSSGGNSAVERRPSKPTVEGSTPSPRSKRLPPSDARTDKGISQVGGVVADQGGGKPPPKKRGRPATGFDKKSYDREQAAKRRAAKKQPQH